MKQARIFATGDARTARLLLDALETEFEPNGYPVSTFEHVDAPDVWEIMVYVPATDIATAHKRLQPVLHRLGIEVGFTAEELPDIDWVEATLRDLAAVRAGRFIIHGSHDMTVLAAHQIAIAIDAGLAFGTGHHGTTVGCLEMLTRVSKRTNFNNALDLGTGSGVLAIAVSKLTCARVLASDIDPVATQTARDNSRKNAVHSRVECITAPGFSHKRFSEQGPFDLVIANILARPLQTMARDISRHATPGGSIILSGLLPHQRAAVIATFRQHQIHLEYAHYRDGWMTLVLVRR